jgi:hypothetical protein
MGCEVVKVVSGGGLMAHGALCGASHDARPICRSVPGASVGQVELYSPQLWVNENGDGSLYE